MYLALQIQYLKVLWQNFLKKNEKSFQIISVSLEETKTETGDCISSKLIKPCRFGKDHIDPVLLQKETKTKLNLFILDSSISSKLFFREAQ